MPISQKDRARNALAYAIRKGRIHRPNKCPECNKECVLEGHHSDYNKSLEVDWLCRQCHKSIKHSKLGMREVTEEEAAETYRKFYATNRTLYET